MVKKTCLTRCTHEGNIRINVMEVTHHFQIGLMVCLTRCPLMTQLLGPLNCGYMVTSSVEELTAISLLMEHDIKLSPYNFSLHPQIYTFLRLHERSVFLQ